MFPHLTDLQRKNKARGLRVVGVTNEQNSPKLQQFVNEMGYGMDYTVAVDADGELEQKLSGPAGVRGIPHAFVVDSQGTVKYSGHPAQPQFQSEVDRALDAAKPAQVALPLIASSREELMALPLKEIKKILTDRKIRTDDIYEKGEFVSRILDRCANTTYYVDAPAGGAAPAANPSAPAEKPRQPTAGANAPSQADSGAAAPPPPAPLPEDIAGMGVGALKAALKERGISLDGLVEKKDLIKRLEEERQ